MNPSGDPEKQVPVKCPPRIGLSILGAVAGACVGYLAFAWLLGQGFYALVLPGALLGLGYGLFNRARNIPAAIICGVMALALGLFCEWRHSPFIADPGLRYFLTHLHQLRPWTWLMVGLGGLAGFWFALGRDPRRA